MSEVDHQSNNVAEEHINGHSGQDNNNVPIQPPPSVKATIPSITTENNDEEDAKAEAELIKMSTGIVNEILPPADSLPNGSHTVQESEPSPQVEDHTETPPQEVPQPEKVHETVEQSEQPKPSDEILSSATSNQEVPSNEPECAKEEASMIVECGSEAEVPNKVAEVESQAEHTSPAESHVEATPQEASSNEEPSQTPVEEKPSEVDTMPVSAHDLQQHQEQEHVQEETPAQQESQQEVPAEEPTKAEPEEPVVETQPVEVVKVTAVESEPASQSPPLSHHSMHDEPLVRDEPEPLKDQLLNPHQVEQVKEPEPVVEKVETPPVTSQPAPVEEPAVVEAVVHSPAPEPAATVSAPSQEAEPKEASAEPSGDAHNASGSSKASTLPRRYLEAARKRCIII